MSAQIPHRQIINDPDSNFLSGGTFRLFALILMIELCLSGLSRAAENELTNAALTVRINSADGSYAIATKETRAPTLRARVSAQVDHHWINSSEYPKHDIVQSDFEDALGHGRQTTVTSTGLKNRLDLIYTIRLYENHPYGDIQVQLRNQATQTVQIQSIRVVEAVGQPVLDLGATPASERKWKHRYSCAIQVQRSKVGFSEPVDECIQGLVRQALDNFAKESKSNES